MQTHDTVDQSRQPAQRVGLFVPIGVPVVDAFDAGEGVAHDALGVIGENTARLINERAVRRRSWIVQ